jgi:hypothetical protein
VSAITSHTAVCAKAPPVAGSDGLVLLELAVEQQDRRQQDDGRLMKPSSAHV